jgi:hypothetical protein
MSIATVPRQVVRLGFAGARLPLSIAEKVAERQGVDLSGLPPVAVYDALEAQAKMLVGRITRDEELVEEGLLQEKATRHRAGAERLSGAAEAVRDGAQEKLGERIDRAEETREQIEEQTEARRAQVRREEEEAKKAAREKARKREQAVRQAARAREKAVEAKERKAELARIKAEAEALEKESKAINAERVVSTIDEHLDAQSSRN